MANRTRHSVLTAGELHYSKINIASSPPSAIPTYTGESYFNSTSNIFFVAIGTGSAADWQPVLTGTSVNNQTGTTYTVVNSDNGKLVNLTNTAGRTVTLPSNPVNGFSIGIFDGAGTSYDSNITIDSGVGDQFYDGASTYKIISNYGGIIFTYDSSAQKWVSASQFIGETLITDHILDSTTIDGTLDHTKQLQFALAGATTSTKTTLAASQTANRTVTLPDATDTLVGKATNDILSNKSFSNATVMRGASQLRFNNSGNTNYSYIQAGNNVSNIGWVLPISNPSTGQVLGSQDASGTLGWYNASVIAQQNVASSANINALSSSTESVCITGGVATNLNGITAGIAGQELTLLNLSTQTVTVVNASGSASSVNQIVTPDGLNFTVPSGYAMKFQYDNPNQVWKPIFNVVQGRDIVGSIQGSLLTGSVSGSLISGLIPGTTTGTTIPTGYIGEFLSANGSTTSFPASPAVSTITNINGVSAGYWTVSASVYLQSGYFQNTTGVVQEVLFYFLNSSGTNYQTIQLPIGPGQTIYDFNGTFATKYIDSNSILDFLIETNAGSLVTVGFATTVKGYLSCCRRA